MKTHNFNDQHQIVRTHNVPVAVQEEEGAVVILFPPAPAHDSCDGTAMQAMDCMDCVFDSRTVCTACFSHFEYIDVPENLHKQFIAWAIQALLHFDDLTHPWFDIDASNPLE